MCPLQNNNTTAQLEVAETVYNDILARAWRLEQSSLPAPVARRGGLSNRAQLPDSEALASLVQVGGGVQEH